ncbi:RDD family protein [Pleionea sediminis]|uniref:RDD family protein n=1 Tax=Pleionea sediminis TaxID=2569479 RepID=UPI0011851A20|nr:RDD family protein [Pleionea sediminis]
MTDPFKTPESDVTQPTNSQLNLANRGLRFLGALLDTIFLMIPVAIIFFLLGFYALMDSDGQLPIFYQIMSFFIGIGVYLMINGYLIYNRGQTLGKLICGTKVVTLEGKQVSGNTYLFLRLLPIWIVSQIPLIGGIITIVDALLIFRKDHNCLHDDIAKTRVVEI